MKSPVARLLVVTACLLGVTAYLGVASRAEVLPPREPLADLPMSFDGWAGRREPDFEDDIVAVLGVNEYIVRSYFKSGTVPMGLYIGFHESQRQGDTIHSPLNCLPGAGWIPLEQGRAAIPVQGAPGGGAGLTPVEVNRVIIGKGLDRNLVFYWYQSHRRVVASEYWGKIYTVLDSVRYHRTDAALVRVIAPIPEGADVASVEKTATSFVQAIFPLLRPHLPQ